MALHHQPAYAAMFPGASFPVSERLAREVMSLPMHADLDEATQLQIVAALREVLAG
jgi:UDP-2-acetamido-2-deoxy-ribo-hexuluronate aminotransferase